MAESNDQAASTMEVLFSRVEELIERMHLQKVELEESKKRVDKLSRELQTCKSEIDTFKKVSSNNDENLQRMDSLEAERKTLCDQINGVLTMIENSGLCEDE